MSKVYWILSVIFLVALSVLYSMDYVTLSSQPSKCIPSTTIIFASNITTDAIFPSASILTANTELPKVCIGVRTYIGQQLKLPALIFSLLATQYPNLEVILMDTGTEPFLEMQNFIDSFNKLVGKQFMHNLNIRRDEAREIVHAYTEDYGYIQTDLLLHDLYHDNKLGCEYVLITNGDNLYSHEYFAAMKEYMDNNFDLIASEFISHHCQAWGQTCRPYQCDGHVYAKFKVNWIDLGAAVIRLEFLKQQNVYFMIDPSRTSIQYPEAFAADGRVFEALARATTKKIIIERALFFHQ